MSQCSDDVDCWSYLVTMAESNMRYFSSNQTPCFLFSIFYSSLLSTTYCYSMLFLTHTLQVQIDWSYRSSGLWKHDCIITLYISHNSYTSHTSFRVIVMYTVLTRTSALIPRNLWILSRKTKHIMVAFNTAASDFHKMYSQSILLRLWVGRYSIAHMRYFRMRNGAATWSFWRERSRVSILSSMKEGSWGCP